MSAFKGNPHPRVSVVVPVFNPGNLLTGALRQLDSLTFSDYEVILIDDASTDGTPAVIRDASEADSRLRSVRLEHNLGPGGARNAGIEAALGEFVWFVDWDDEWEPTILSKLVEAADRTRSDVVACRGRWRRDGVDGAITDGIDREATVTPSNALDLILEGKLKGYLWTKLVRRSALHRKSFPDIRTSEDLCALASTLPRTSTVSLVPDVLYFHVVRPGSLTNSANPPLRNLEYAREVLHEASAQLRPADSRRRANLLKYYDSVHWLLAHATTAIRHSDAATAAAEARWARRQITISHVANALRFSAPDAAKLFVFKTTGPLFSRFRAIGLNVRRVVVTSR